MTTTYRVYKPWLSTWPKYMRDDTCNTLSGLAHEKVAVMDTETTGLTKHSEITEISIVDYHTSEILINTLVRPKQLDETFDSSRASELTGLKYNVLREAPTFLEIVPTLLPILRDYTLAGWNATFDAKMVIRSAFQWRICVPQFDVLDVMALFQAFIEFSDWNTLEEAQKIVGLELSTNNHRALQDVYSTISVLKEMQKKNRMEV